MSTTTKLYNGSYKSYLIPNPQSNGKKKKYFFHSVWKWLHKSHGFSRFSPDGRKIDPRARGEYTVKTYLERENSRTVLRVNKPKLSNLGTYTLKVTNGNLSRTENFTLIVRSKPMVRVEVVNPQGLYSQGHEYTIKCVAEGYPIPTINWYFKPCSTFIDCTRERTDPIRQRLNHRITNTHR